jgi:hypothetical protein
MALLSSSTACRPKALTSAAAELALKSPPSVNVDDQAERLPDSNPSEKIRSDMDVGLAVGEEVGVGEYVAVGVDVFVGLGVKVRVKVGVGV